MSPALRFWWGTWLALLLVNAPGVASVYDPDVFVGSYHFLPPLVAWILAIIVRLICGILAAWIVWNLHGCLEEKANSID